MLCLHKLAKIKLSANYITSLAFGDNGNLGVTPRDHCAYIFDQNGNLLNKVCGNSKMLDASYSSGRFGFINWDDYAYITDENGNLIKKIHVGDDYDEAITMRPDGFVACDVRCAFFDFNGNKLWDVDVGFVKNGPAYYKGYWYVADYGWNELLIINDGSIVNSIVYSGEWAYDTAICGNYLAVSTSSHLYLYDLSNPEKPKEIWKVKGFRKDIQVTFSPNCKYVAVVDGHNNSFETYNFLKIYSLNLNGKLVLEKRYDDVYSVAWWKNRIAVGLGHGRIYMYKVAEADMKFPLNTSSEGDNLPA